KLHRSHRESADRRTERHAQVQQPGPFDVDGHDGRGEPTRRLARHLVGEYRLRVPRGAETRGGAATGAVDTRARRYRARLRRRSSISCDRHSPAPADLRRNGTGDRSTMRNAGCQRDGRMSRRTDVIAPPAASPASGAEQYARYPSQITLECPSNPALAHRTRARMSRQPYLSVIMPVHKGAHVLPLSLGALEGSFLPRDRWELVVVDDASPD